MSPPPAASGSGESFVPVVDVAVGAFDVSMGELAGPAFLRLARSSGGAVDGARSLYLSGIGARLTAAKTGFIDGPGLLVEDTPPGDPASLRRELLVEAGHACAALAEEAVARSYVGFFEERPETPSLETRVRVDLDADTQNQRRPEMSTAATVPLRIDRQDGAHGFDDPSVPGEWTIEELTHRVAPKLRYPTTDVGTGKPLRYSMLHEGIELRRDEKVGDALLQDRRARVHVVHEYANAR